MARAIDKCVYNGKMGETLKHVFGLTRGMCGTMRETEQTDWKRFLYTRSSLGRMALPPLGSSRNWPLAPEGLIYNLTLYSYKR
jgi:hypothetical protein